MGQELRRHIADRIHLGELQQYQKMAVVPLVASITGGPEYITLKQAFELGGFSVAEVSESGSVPNLKVINETGKNVLLLDGEELAGAKQNRVLNTTILLPAGEARVIPVSCTEQGRWRYTSTEFNYSGHIMAKSVRACKTHSVSQSVRSRRDFMSNQAAVWDGIEELHRSHGTSSGTGAMRDAFEARRGDVESYQEQFACIDNQCGLAVLIKGRVAGIEFVSSPDAYRLLHEKILGSYIMDIPLAKAGRSEPSIAKVQKVLERIMAGTEDRFPSVGLGEDCRYTIPEIVGSALACDDWYVHAAFFRDDDRSGATIGHLERMSSMSRRRANRRPTSESSE